MNFSFVKLFLCFLWFYRRKVKDFEFIFYIVYVWYDINFCSFEFRGEK